MRVLEILVMVVGGTAILYGILNVLWGFFMLLVEIFRGE